MSDINRDLEARIREQAYALWERDGCPEGRAEEYWEQARRVITEETDTKAPDMVADPPL